jgi:hypothetical protein
VRFCSNFSRSSFRLCVKSIPSADSRSELCGTDTLRPRCVGCNRDFSLRFFLRLPFTPLWSPIWSFNWYQSLVELFSTLTGSKTTWRPWRVLVRSLCLPARTMLIGRCVCEPSCKAWELRFGRLPRTRLTRCLPFGPHLFRCPSTRLTPRLSMPCSLAFLVRSSHVSRVFRKPTKFGRALRTTTRAHLR